MTINVDMTTREKIAEILVNIDAVSLSPASPFKYASGMLSPIYTDCRLLASYPIERKMIVEELVRHVKGTSAEFDVIVGAGSSAIALATQIARRMRLPMVYVRPEAKSYGKEKQIEGVFEEGNKALLVADIMSTEEDIANSVCAIQRQEGVVAYCVAVFSNNLGITEQFLEKRGIGFHCVTDLRSVLKVALSKGKMSQDEVSHVEEWMSDPENWAALRQQRLEKSIQTTKREVAEILLRIGSVAINVERPFQYASGILSPVYTDNRLLMSHPDEWDHIISCLLDQVVNEIGVQNIKSVAGTATSAISHAAYLADRLNLPMTYVKSTAEDYGKRNKIEGVINSGDKVLLIEDLISTGKSAISAVETLRGAGASVDWCLVIFSYGLASASAAFRSADVRLLALSDLGALLDASLELGRITLETKAEVDDWAHDPTGWAAKRPVHLKGH